MVTHAQAKLRILRTLRLWAKEHPAPDLPVLHLLGRDLSPLDVVDEVAQGTKFGNELVSYLEEASERYNLPPEEFIKRAIRANSQLT